MFFFMFTGGSVAKLTISNETTIPAERYARLIAALASEYARLSPGHTLGVAKVEHGSIITYLIDIAAAAGGMTAAVEALEAFRKLFDAVSGSLERIRSRRNSLPNRRDDGDRTVIECFKMSLAARATIKLAVSHPNGAIEELTVTPNEAAALVDSTWLSSLGSTNKVYRKIPIGRSATKGSVAMQRAPRRRSIPGAGS